VLEAVDVVKLAQVLQPVSRPEAVDPSETYSLLGARWYARGLYIKAVKLGSEIRARTVYRISDGDFVYNRLFAWMGSFAVASKENEGCHASNEFLAFEVDRDQLDPDFLWAYFSRRAAWNEALGLSSGSTPTSRNRLKEAAFLAMAIPLPSLDEQRAIVTRLTRIEGAVDAAQSHCRLAVAATDALVRASLGEILRPQRHWRTMTIDEVCAKIVDNLHSNPMYADDGVPCIRSPDVGWGTLNLDSARRTTEAEYTRRTRRAEPMEGDIVLVREGGGTGKAALVEAGQRFSLGQRVMMLRPNSEIVLPRFFLFQLLSPLIQEEQIRPRILGSASPHLNIGALRKFSFLVPSMDEQAAIVKDLASLTRLISDLRISQSRTADELTALREAVLSDAFTMAAHQKTVQ
jgi:type I restriction enzyme, S subunit